MSTGNHIIRGNQRMNDNSEKTKEYNFRDWPAPLFLTGRSFKQYINEELKARLIGKPITSMHTMGVLFNNWDGEELEVWDNENHLQLDEPIVIVCGDGHLEVHFHNTSQAKVGLNTLTMNELSYQHAPWRDVSRLYPHIVGEVIADIRLSTFTKGFEDSVSWDGVFEKPDGGDYFDAIGILLENDYALKIEGLWEYMYVIQHQRRADSKMFPTHSRVHTLNGAKEAQISPFITFVPYHDKYEDAERALCLSDDDWHTLHWAIRHVFPDYDMYNSDFSICIEDWERVMAAWGFVFSANSFDEVLEKFCGIDYISHTVKDKSLLHYFNNTGYLWKDRDREWEIYDDFVTWFDEVKNCCTHIHIEGI